MHSNRIVGPKRPLVAANASRQNSSVRSHSFSSNSRSVSSAPSSTSIDDRMSASVVCRDSRQGASESSSASTAPPPPTPSEADSSKGRIPQLAPEDYQKLMMLTLRRTVRISESQELERAYMFTILTRPFDLHCTCTVSCDI